MKRSWPASAALSELNVKISDDVPELSTEYGEESFAREQTGTTTWIDQPYPGPVRDDVLEVGSLVKLSGSSQPIGVVVGFDSKDPSIVDVQLDPSMTAGYPVGQVEPYFDS
jgi:hypothetical protein